MHFSNWLSTSHLYHLKAKNFQSLVRMKFFSVTTIKKKKILRCVRRKWSLPTNKERDRQDSASKIQLRLSKLEDNQLRTLQAAEPCLCVTLEIHVDVLNYSHLLTDSHLSTHGSVACMAHICDVSVGLPCSSREIFAKVCFF